MIGGGPNLGVIGQQSVTCRGPIRTRLGSADHSVGLGHPATRGSPRRQDQSLQYQKYNQRSDPRDAGELQQRLGPLCRRFGGDDLALTDTDAAAIELVFDDGTAAVVEIAVAGGRDNDGHTDVFDSTSDSFEVIGSGLRESGRVVQEVIVLQQESDSSRPAGAGGGGVECRTENQQDHKSQERQQK